MDWPRVDYHTHICGTTIDAMLAGAAERGLREYGISEHIFQLDEGHVIFPYLEEAGVRFPRQWYADTCLDRRGAAGVDLRIGLEVDFVPGREAEVAAVLAGVEWDYLIGSVHEIDGLDFFEQAPADEGDGRRLWERYFQLLLEAIDSGMFDVISHPVRNAVLNPHVPEQFDEFTLAISERAALQGVALELNGEDVTRWPELVRRLVNACGRAGCAVSLGSDAHCPATVARGLLAATEMARAANVPGVASFRRRERRLLPLA